ncbi:hypothetical protein DBR47_23895 [Paucibacter sp. KBW04]|uniref:hypothetical protein n=1 Tax=Paucibacter sp. KBW04 TaxID=2153361 RepID=UPI000F58A5D3|nr:hypothetical protein [Paucibacter sp. KBW04]RQO53466.1 hypothetical protein DBR47_23895 [Paucibacter sp. KBW04]
MSFATDLDSSDGQAVYVPAGVAYPLPPGGGLWRLRSGAMRLDCPQQEGENLVKGLALPGDLLGIEALCPNGLPAQLRALTACRLQPVALADDAASSALLLQALSQSQRQQRDFAQLRTGPVGERIKALLLMLTRGETTPEACTLPALREMAALIDSAHETISRVISSMLRLDLLQDRRPTSVRVNRQALHGFRPTPSMSSSNAAALLGVRKRAVHELL